MPEDLLGWSPESKPRLAAPVPLRTPLVAPRAGSTASPSVVGDSPVAEALALDTAAFSQYASMASRTALLRWRDWRAERASQLAKASAGVLFFPLRLGWWGWLAGATTWRARGGNGHLQAGRLFVLHKAFLCWALRPCFPRLAMLLQARRWHLTAQPVLEVWRRRRLRVACVEDQNPRLSGARRLDLSDRFALRVATGRTFDSTFSQKTEGSRRQGGRRLGGDGRAPSIRTAVCRVYRHAWQACMADICIYTYMHACGHICGHACRA